MARFAAIRGSVLALACAAALAGCAKEPEPDDTLSPQNGESTAGPPPPLTVEGAAPVASAVDTAAAPQLPTPTTVPQSSNEAAAGAITTPLQPATPATPATDSGQVSH